MPRPKIGEKPLTNLEKQRRFRAKRTAKIDTACDLLGSIVRQSSDPQSIADAQSALDILQTIKS